MDVYRIVHKKWSRKLTASTNEARWNSRGQLIIYSAASRALACLENIVHRSGEGLAEVFRTMVIEIPGNIRIEKIDSKILPDDWEDFENYFITQKHGDDWLMRMSSAVLRVPSAIIPEEFNYLINPAHSDFKRIRLKKTERFVFDSRIVSRKKSRR